MMSTSKVFHISSKAGEPHSVGFSQPGGFPANPANPSFEGLRNHLNIRETGIGKKFTMLIYTQQRHARERQANNKRGEFFAPRALLGGSLYGVHR